MVLAHEGEWINRKRVQRYMREMGIAGIAPGPKLSKRASQHRMYPYLLRGVTASVPNQIWGSDITYIRLRHGWLSLVAILDWYSRYVVSWALDATLELPFVLDAVGQALRTATPQIWNTDQGSPFTSPQLTTLIAEAGAQIRMDGKGRAFDNIFTERFWRSLKYENIYLSDYGSPREARQGIAQYIQFSNTERPHQALADRCPVEVYRGEPYQGCGIHDSLAVGGTAQPCPPPLSQCQVFQAGAGRHPYGKLAQRLCLTWGATIPCRCSPLSPLRPPCPPCRCQRERRVGHWADHPRMPLRSSGCPTKRFSRQPKGYAALTIWIGLLEVFRYWFWVEVRRYLIVQANVARPGAANLQSKICNLKSCLTPTAPL